MVMVMVGGWWSAACSDCGLGRRVEGGRWGGNFSQLVEWHDQCEVVMLDIEVFQFERRKKNQWVFAIIDE